MTRMIMKRTMFGAIFTLEKDFSDGTVYFAVNGNRTGKTFSNAKSAFEWVKSNIFEES